MYLYLFLLFIVYYIVAELLSLKQFRWNDSFENYSFLSELFSQFFRFSPISSNIFFFFFYIFHVHFIIVLLWEFLYSDQMTSFNRGMRWEWRLLTHRWGLTQFQRIKKNNIYIIVNSFRCIKYGLEFYSIV